VNQPVSSSPWPLRALLLLALVLFGCGIWWGLPGRWGWAGDELHPSSWGEAISWQAPTNHHEWHLRYPPLHFAVLQGTSFPLRWLIDHGYLFAGDKTGVAGLTALIYFGRFISLIMALGTLLVLYRVGREIYDRRSALFTVLITMCIAPLVYYAKMGNLDVPYLFWFALSLLFYLRILKQHRLRDYVLFAAAAAAAVCTKDQAYGLYSLAPLPILYSLYRRDFAERGAVHGLARALVDKRMLLAALTAALLFGVFGEVLFNPQRFAVHIKLLRGPMSENYQDYEDTAEGHQMLLSLFVKQVAFVLDPLLALVCIAGIGVTAWRAVRKQADEEDLLLGCVFFLFVSYYVTFLNLILFSYDRYLLPVAVILAFFGGRALGLLTRPGVRWLRLRQVAVAAGFVYALLYASSVDARLLADSRYYVEDWIQKNAPRPLSVAAVGRKKHIPRFQWIPWEKVLRTKTRILQFQRPQFLTVTVSDLRRPEEVAIYQQLTRGELGYRLVLLYEGHPLYDLLNVDGVGSSQRFINPEMAVFQRIDSGPASGPAREGVPSDALPVAHSPHGGV
jgi:hypothetical protein